MPVTEFWRLDRKFRMVTGHGEYHVEEWIEDRFGRKYWRRVPARGRTRQLRKDLIDYYNVHKAEIKKEPGMRPMEEIPIDAAKHIAERYGYDQVIIIGRRCDGTPPPVGEHITTYGRNPQHCYAAGLISKKLQEIMGWKS